MRVRLENAKLYEEEIRREMWRVENDVDYQYYFGSDHRHDFSLVDQPTLKAFAVIDNYKDKLWGYISYHVDTNVRLGHRFGAINFKHQAGMLDAALPQVIDDCFKKYGLEAIEWVVIVGNPVESYYDRVCKRFGGRVVGIQRKRARDLAGNLCDVKLYEITKEDYFRWSEQ